MKHAALGTSGKSHITHVDLHAFLAHVNLIDLQMVLGNFHPPNILEGN